MEGLLRYRIWIIMPPPISAFLWQNLKKLYVFVFQDSFSSPSVLRIQKTKGHLIQLYTHSLSFGFYTTPLEYTNKSSLQSTHSKKKKNIEELSPSFFPQLPPFPLELDISSSCRGKSKNFRPLRKFYDITPPTRPHSTFINLEQPPVPNELSVRIYVLLSDLDPRLSLRSVSEFSLCDSISKLPCVLRCLLSWMFNTTISYKLWDLYVCVYVHKSANHHMSWEEIEILTSLGIGYSSDSSILTTWPILGLFSESGSTHLRAVRSARFRALVDGLTSMFGSTTSSDRLLPTIIFSQSTRFTCMHQWFMSVQNDLVDTWE